MEQMHLRFCLDVETGRGAARRTSGGRPLLSSPDWMFKDEDRRGSSREKQSNGERVSTFSRPSQGND